MNSLSRRCAKRVRRTAVRGELDPDTDRETRKKLLRASSATKALVPGKHLASPSSGRVFPAEDGYRFVSEAGQ